MKVRFGKKSLFAGLAVAGCLCALFVSGRALLELGYQRNYRDQCSNNLKQIGLALRQYHDVFGCFPPPCVRAADGRPLHSWRALILPYLGSPATGADYDFSEPFDSPANSQVARSMPGQRPYGVFRCWTDTGPPSDTSYLAVIGPASAWDAEAPALPTDASDPGKVMVIEVINSGVNWAEPLDFETKNFSSIVRIHPGQAVHVLFADGTVRHFTPQEMSSPEFKAMLIPESTK